MPLVMAGGPDFPLAPRFRSPQITSFSGLNQTNKWCGESLPPRGAATATVSQNCFKSLVDGTQVIVHRRRSSPHPTGQTWMVDRPTSAENCIACKKTLDTYMPPKGKKKDSTPAASKAAPTSSTEQKPPNWPPFRPLIPSSDLSLQQVLPGQIVTIPNFWPASLCKTYVSFLASLPLTTTPGKPKKGEAVRVNDRFQLQDPVFAKRLWEETCLRDLVLGTVETEDGMSLSPDERKDLWGGQVVGLNPNIRIYRYGRGQFFDQHYDDFNNLVIPGDPAIQARTTWTLLLYLTSPATGCIGGETVFYPEPPKGRSKRDPPPEPLAVGLEVGLALLHRHGAECMLHEGREVLAGEKWVIRSDLCVQR